MSYYSDQEWDTQSVLHLFSYDERRGWQLLPGWWEEFPGVGTSAVRLDKLQKILFDELEQEIVCHERMREEQQRERRKLQRRQRQVEMEQRRQQQRMQQQ